ncbi:hypothetical protein E308F_25820 [Moorella sp. E308F]|jgi:plasmid stability protein|uniref:Ribbon-helix-helix protein CopG domain-containing protein n=1 Tax=Neomoorella humiferrea TaxID=676965 RepID=A0A2T0ARA9_9FIRM|nr:MULTISPECIES: ribbon-helix-helix protein, CopG family [Moorella]PRR71908.1 hypothetical protein MOHU_15400 [Moorella humiferrea]GEA16336.1 hypothetical protein E308F_25820 [Moorella sp. E308F]
MSRFSKIIQIRVTDDLDKRLRAEATRRELSVAVLVRDILEKALNEEAAIDGREALDRAIRRAIKKDVDRLAGLLVKSTMAGATAMFLNVQVLNDLGKRDAADIYHIARKKAVEYLRLPENDSEVDQP